MTYGDVLLERAMKKLKECSNGHNRVRKKDALDVFARRIKFDKNMGKITLKELEKRKRISIGRKITIL